MKNKKQATVHRSDPTAEDLRAQLAAVAPTLVASIMVNAPGQASAVARAALKRAVTEGVERTMRVTESHTRSFVTRHHDGVTLSSRRLVQEMFRRCVNGDPDPWINGKPDPTLDRYDPVRVARDALCSASGYYLLDENEMLAVSTAIVALDRIFAARERARIRAAKKEAATKAREADKREAMLRIRGGKAR